MSNDVKQVGSHFAQDFLTGVQNNAVSNLTDDDDTGGGAQDITRINDPSLQSQIALMDIQNTCLLYTSPSPRDS